MLDKVLNCFLATDSISVRHSKVVEAGRGKSSGVRQSKIDNFSGGGATLSGVAGYIHIFMFTYHKKKRIFHAFKRNQ